MRALFDRLLSSLNIIASLAVVGIMFLIAADVIGRAGFNRSVAGVPEIVKVSIVCIVWLQMAHTLRRGGHLQSSLIFGVLPSSMQRIVSALNCLAGIAVFGLIAWYASDDVLKTFQRGTFEGEHPVRIPVWPIWAILVLGAALTAIEYAAQLVRMLKSGATVAAYATDPIEDGTSS